MPRISTRKGGVSATKKGKRKRVILKKRPKKISLKSARRQHRLKATPAVIQEIPMTQAMVDRLFWRAGFGPTAEARSAFTGKKTAEAVDWLLDSPQGALQGPAPKNGVNALDIFGERGNDDLVTEWIDRMVRSPNPLPERMRLFWHGHWANSREDVSPAQLMKKQNDVLGKYSDLAANPNADFATMSYEMATDPAMLRYLTGETNVRGRPNENYAREIMELFVLGVVDGNGKPNYTEQDVKELAKAFSGWRIRNDSTDNGANAMLAEGYFTPSRWDAGVKTLSWGKSGAFKDREATEAVLAHPNQPFYVTRKLWDYFVPTAPTADVHAQLVKTYVSSGFKIKPVVRQILLSAELFASIDEPTMIKPPAVYVAGALRATKAAIIDTDPVNSMMRMGQRPYYPPTVAGWEGGISWLNTNTVLERYGFIGRVVGKMPDLTDQPTETPQAAFDRAFGATASPWVSAASKANLLDLANRAPARTAAQRKNRQVVLRTLLLAGPDAQVM